jgi:hypothetical protein
VTGASLAHNLREYGLFVRGITRLTDAEIDTFAVDPDNAEVALVGNIGSSYWSIFSASPEYLDGAGHPLDRWSRRVAESIEHSFSLRALYPFDGPPYFPFQQWARRAEGLLQSPLGVMIHPEFGLWHSYRFALLGADLGAQESLPNPASLCSDCIDKPCLHTCPVDAFDGDSYAVAVCASYLRDTPLAECNQRGCLARYACPVAPELRYLDAQGQFHLRAFVDAQQNS